MIIEKRDDTLIYRVHTKGFNIGLELCVLPFRLYGYCLKVWCRLFRRHTIEIQININTEAV